MGGGGDISGGVCVKLSFRDWSKIVWEDIVKNAD
ncbi:hypothetical protein M316_0033 [Nitrincola phage 1M3-16]|nr:hypothetical protein GJ22_gp119 [Nitrincola phage 1M3-16]AHX01098.1 hypothetical protein M316_0033 [Nitrincola phage 1M3-16]